jgi:hypothetical protein
MHPLDNLDKFVLPEVEPIALPITSIVMETRPEMMNIIRQITTWHRKWFHFAREIIISDCDPHIEGTTFVNCGRPPPKQMFIAWYSDMCVKSMIQLCQTPFVLMWQWDGFIVSPTLWKNDFLNYDYIGGPVIDKYWMEGVTWLKKNKEEWKDRPIPAYPVVGNGGFSLRSRRFLEVSSTLANTQEYIDDYGHSTNEDFYLCVRKRKEMEDAGIRFSTLNLANDFSREGADKRPFDECFGFHGMHNLLEVKVHLESKYIPR